MFDTRRVSLAVAALLALLAAVPQQAAATSQVPFSAMMNETFAVIPCAPNSNPNVVCVSVAGSGQATQLGNTGESSEVFVNLSTPVCHAETRTVILTAANGDQVTLALTGQSCDTNSTPITGTASDSWVVSGGTGRFSGATGSGTNSALIYGLTGTAVTTFTGTLSTPGSL
jgi:hypothetical protein